MNIYCGCVCKDTSTLKVIDGTEVWTAKAILPDWPMTVEKIGVEQHRVGKVMNKGNPAPVYRHYPNIDKRSCKHCGVVIYLEG